MDIRSTPHIEDEMRRRESRVRALMSLVGIGIVAIIAWHFSAGLAFQRSFDRSRPLADRAADASRAAQLEPWNPGFVTRATVMRKWERGSVLLSQGAYLPAMLELADAYKLDVGDTELLALFQKAQQGLNANSNFKAHVQHGHEATGGMLRPQDLLP